MSVNIINLDEKCLTAAMRNFVALLCKPCTPRANENEMEGGMTSEDVCETGRPQSKSIDELEIRINEQEERLHVLRDEISNFKTEVMNTFVKMELTNANYLVEQEERLNVVDNRVSELEDIERLDLGDFESFANEKLKLNEDAHRSRIGNLEDVVGGLSRDVLLNNSEIERLKNVVSEALV